MENFHDIPIYYDIFHDSMLDIGSFLFLSIPMDSLRPIKPRCGPQVEGLAPSMDQPTWGNKCHPEMHKYGESKQKMLILT